MLQPGGYINGIADEVGTLLHDVTVVDPDSPEQAQFARIVGDDGREIILGPNRRFDRINGTREAPYKGISRNTAHSTAMCVKYASEQLPSHKQLSAARLLVAVHYFAVCRAIGKQDSSHDTPHSACGRVYRHQAQSGILPSN